MPDSDQKQVGNIRGQTLETLETLNTSEQDELRALRRRNRKLAEDKAYLRLIVRMIEKINPMVSIDNMISTMLVNIVEVVGGSNARLWYQLGHEQCYVDALGSHHLCSRIDDELALQAVRDKRLIEQAVAAESLARQAHGSLPDTVWNWAFPLMVGEECIGAIKLETLQLSSQRLREYLPIFISHVALLLASEIRNILRFRAEAELHATNLELNRYFNASLEMFCIAERDGRLRKLNPVWQKILNYAQGELQNYNLFDLVHADDVDATRKVWQTLSAQVPTCNFSNRLRCKNGEFRWIEWQLHSEGELVFAAARDRTEHKLIEDKLRLAASVFNHSQEGMLITDANNCIINVNSAFTEITGYKKSEVVGKNPHILASGRHDRPFYDELWNSLRERSAWSGEIWNCRKSGEIYPKKLNINVVHNETGKIINYLAVFTDITESKAREAALDQVAHYDALTGLPNRRLLADRLEQAIARSVRSSQPLAVCFLDLDGFKPVNDLYGHDAGDQLLIEITRRLQEDVRGEDTVARLGGDEFVLLFNEVGDQDAVMRLLDRVQERICEPINMGTHAVLVSASLGVTLCPPDQADADILLRHADQAMYQAKNAGKRCCHFYDATQDQQVIARQEAQNRLARAFANHELLLHYQPRIRLLNGKCIGVEASIRWQHPQQGLLVPDHFLHLINDTALERELNHWVIDQVLQQLQQWALQGLRITVSINISCRSILQTHFSLLMQQRLACYPAVQGQQIEFEILEATDASEALLKHLLPCQAMGIRFAMDDFASGYSSLTYLHRLPAGTVKIDQVFVRNMLDDGEAMSMVDTIIKLAQAFERPVLSEGIESFAHAATLIQMGCDYGQGNAIAQPMTATQLDEWLKTWPLESTWHTLAKTLDMSNDLALQVAALDHQRWVDALERFLQGQSTYTAIELDEQQCRFGRWYYGPGTQHYAGCTGFAEIAAPHDRVHAIAKSLLLMISKGNPQAALSQLHELRAACQTLSAALARLVAHVRQQQPDPVIDLDQSSH